MLLLAILAVMLSTTPAMTENDAMHYSPRRRVYFGSMDALQRTMPDFMTVSNASRCRRVPEGDEGTILDVARRKKRPKSVEENDDDDDAQEKSSANKLWPPWPFNLLTQRGSKNDNLSRDSGYRSSGTLFWAYFGQRLLITKRQFQHGECFQ